jgi:streptogramin lyase
MRYFRLVSSAQVLPAIVALLASIALAGCGAVEGTPAVTMPLAEIAGHVHGGQQPIAGAKVYLYAAGSTGYGAGAISLLNSPGYTLTDANGAFSFNGLYSLAACQTAHQQVYAVAVGGNPGAGTNDSSVLMSAVGDCANLTSSSYIWINEVTTVASAYALQQFMSPGTVEVGASATNLIGLQNAFLAVPNLVGLSTGNALATTPAGNGTVPQAEIYYLSNILAACVNSTTGSSPCSNLFAAATPPGGTAPVDTLGAILDIALNPGHNVSALYLLPPPVVAFPTSFAQPNDWTIAVKYTGGGISHPNFLAVDATGNVWVSNFGAKAVSEFSPAGVSLHGTTGIATPYPQIGISIDTFGEIWVTDATSGTVTGVFSNGSIGQTFFWDCNGFGLVSDATGKTWGSSLQNYACQNSFFGTDVTFPLSISALSIAPTGHFWAPTATQSGQSDPALMEATTSGALVSGEPLLGWSDPAIYNGFLVAFDAQGSAWTANGTGLAHLVTEVSASGTVLSGGGFTDCGPANTTVVDGNNTLWTTDGDGSVCHLAHTGALLSPSTGYKVPGLTYAYHGAVDSAGNLWTTDTGGLLVQWVGVAGPVKTPLVQNLVGNSTGQRP